MDLSNFYIIIIMILLVGVIGYFMKKYFDKTDELVKDISEMKPKVEILWSNIKN